MMPRWWLATNYEPMLTDAEGLAWELRGPGVKAMTEEDFLTANGDRVHTRQSQPDGAEVGQQHDRQVRRAVASATRSSASCATAWTWRSSRP